VSGAAGRERPGLLRRFGPVAVIVAAIAAFFVSGLDEYLTFEALRDNRAVLLRTVEAYGPLAALAFVALYATATALSVPGALVLTMTGGFLFGQGWGTAYALVGATIGAVVIFLIARTAFGNALCDRAGPWLRRMEAGFREGAFSYLLVLRLIPLFPFWLVNIVPALLGVPLRTYTAATLIGIVPGAFVYASVGAGLGSIFDRGGELSVADALTPEVVVALVGLAVLALLPVAYKRWRARRESDRARH
jgi:uncharacterized membrane protein YdjX (TVP38/TMEM64 family)